MKNLIAPTEDYVKVERTKLDADVTAGSNVSLTLENNDGLSQYDYIVIGYEGLEIAELEQINAAVSGSTAVQVATLKFDHKKGEPVVKYRYNQRKFYGCATEAGTYVELTSDGSPKDIEADDPQGTLLEYTGSDYTYFKATYYNEQTGDETDVDDAEAVLADESKRYASLYEIRRQAGLTDVYTVSDERIEKKRKQAENEINSVLFAKYSLPLSEVPDLITNICLLLAAGYLDYEEYAQDGEGKKWLGEARGILKSIAKGTQLLIGSDGSELGRAGSTVGRLKGYPDNSIEKGDSDYRKFEIGQTF